MNVHPREQLSAYVDGELPPDDAAAVERHLRDCTECARELTIMRDMGGAMRTMSTQYRGRGVWNGVHRRITRPVGWLFILVGVAVWAWLAVSRWSQQELTLEWAAGMAVVVGLVLLLLSLGYEQYRDWRETRYKDVEL
jgi:anti-sigma factor RsiW